MAINSTALNTTFSVGANSTGAQDKNGQSAGQFAASFITAISLFAIQVLLFLLIKDRFARIYSPRTYLVPERERTTPTPPGWWKWIKPVLSTSNSEFVQRCGLDAYFFLRYLRTLLKIFVPAALIIIPILIPINSAHGKGARFATSGNGNQANVTGLDLLSWGNIAPTRTHKYWAHFILALGLIGYVCYIAFDELRNYIRMRQAYMTSPQHRLRASATTVLVSSIPQKWCSVEALEGLYDVFPGGLRNIWINRNFDELSDKVKKRDKLALKLEAAETDLIKKCFKKNEKNIEKAQKEAGQKVTKEEKKSRQAIKDEAGQQQAQGHGISHGNPHQINHNLREAAGGAHEVESASSSEDEDEEQRPTKTRLRNRIPVIGEGIQKVSDGFESFGKVLSGGFRGFNRGVNDTIDTTNGFVAPTHENELGRTSGDVPAEMATEDERKLASNRHRHGRPFHGNRKHVTPAPPHTAEPMVDGTSDRGRATERVEENEQHPAAQVSPISQSSTKNPNEPVSSGPVGMLGKITKVLGLNSVEKEPVDYPSAFAEEFEHDPQGAVWRKYLKDKDRDTMRLPVKTWMPSLPFVGEKVDTIIYCREQVARLNVEIEDDQEHPERFPLMNSAFVQFNHQVAAHMACQTVSHHVPQQMAPRLVEIDPNDVIWDNMSIPWWQRYIRTAAVVSLVVAIIVLWAVPVAFTSALSQLNTAAHAYHWLHWVLSLPAWFRSVLQGVLPAALLGLLMFLLPVVLRLLIKLQGTPSGMLIEISVQRYYFCFLFVQLFLVVTIASAATEFIAYVTSADGWSNVASLLGQNIPKASNYFFSYMLLQAMSVSSGALLQVGSLVGWFVLAPLLDTTARSKFKRQTTLSNIQWGTFFPVYTNLACIGLIYSVISPLILIFNILTFSLFWFVYRYNTLYVTRFTRDTGGLLYPNAINFTFVGIYMMEIALIGMFFLVRDEHNNVACTGQAIGMIIIAFLTAVFQFLMNNAFSPLFRYLPITLEDDAVRRDEEFALALRRRHGLIDNEVEGEDLEDQLENKERRSMEEDRDAQEYELERIESDKNRRMNLPPPRDRDELDPYEFQNPEIAMNLDQESKGFKLMKRAAHITADNTIKKIPTLNRPGIKGNRKSSWADRDNAKNRRAANFGEYRTPSHSRPREEEPEARDKSTQIQVLDRLNNLNPLLGNEKDIEAQRVERSKLADAFFANVNDELEDLTPDERDTLVQRAFQHIALRARRPVIWLPRDELGVSDDEVRRMGGFSHSIWVSNVRQGLDGKGRCVYSGAPPDFSEVELIQL